MVLGISLFQKCCFPGTVGSGAKKKRVLVIQMEKGPQVDEEDSSGVWLEISWMSLPARS